MNALLAVTGPGLRISLNDPEAATGNGAVQDKDLQLLVNGLWSAGAEAIAIGGVRLRVTSAIRQAGGAILVDFRPVASPYEVSAIGDPDGLANGFLSSPEASYVVGLQQEYGLQFDFARADDLSLPPATSPEVRWAQPLDGPTGPSTTPETPTDGD